MIGIFTTYIACTMDVLRVVKQEKNGFVIFFFGFGCKAGSGVKKGILESQNLSQFDSLL